MNMIEIDGSFTIERVAELQATLREAMSLDNSSATLGLRLSGVQEFDGAGLQLLLACAAALGKNGRQLELCDVTPALQAVLRQYQLLDRFILREPV